MIQFEIGKNATKVHGRFGSLAVAHQFITWAAAYGQ